MIRARCDEREGGSRCSVPTTLAAVASALSEDVRRTNLARFPSADLTEVEAWMCSRRLSRP